MKLLYKQSIKTKILLGLGILLSILLIGKSVFEYQRTKHRIRKTIFEKELPLLLDNVSLEILQYLDNPVRISSMMANSRFVQKWIEGGEKDTTEIKLYLKKIKKDYHTVNATIATENSHTYYNVQQAYQFANDRKRYDWYYKFRDSGLPHEMKLAWSYWVNNYILYINYRIENEKKEFLGVTGVAISFQELIEKIMNYENERGSSVYFIDKEGYIRIHRDTTLVTKYLDKEESHKKIQNMEGISTVASELLNTGDTRSFEYLKGTDNRLGKLKYIPEIDLYLVVEFSEKEILKDLYKYLTIDFIIAISITLVTLFINIIAINQIILKPLKKLKNNLYYFFEFLNRKQEKVNLITIKSQDEVGKVARMIHENIRNIQKGILKDTRLIQETTQIADQLSRGYLQQQITSEGDNPELVNLKDKINEMLDTLSQKVGQDVNRILEVMHNYGKMDFSKAIEHPGGEVEKNVNQMGHQIQKSYQKTQEQNRALQTRDSQITSSIQAAVTIQNAILPYRQKLDKLLKEHFIIYRPKDGVSGDFYWLNKVKDKTVLVVADCTGHGVPGAFMTMIGNTLLDKIVRVWGITEPNEILTQLHEEIQIVLRQKETGNNNGMDAVVITLEQQTNATTLMTFAGAKNDIYYMPYEEQEVKILRGTRKSIGGEQNEEIEFENKAVTLTANSIIYLGSDGYSDQNNIDRKKLGTRRLEAVLQRNCKYSLTLQKNTLEETLNQHMKGTTQRDDILMMGIKL